MLAALPLEVRSISSAILVSSGIFFTSLKMLAPIFKLTGRVSRICKRDLGIFAPALQKSSDPIQQLFLDKIREYKSKSAGGKLVEPSPEMLKELENEKIRVYRQHNLNPGEDLTKFPEMKFSEPKLEPPTLGKL